jgi:colicin import membrane protein
VNKECVVAFNRSEPGVILSSVLHTLALLGTLVFFSTTPPFELAEEAIAVDIIVDQPTNQVTKGEKSAKEVVSPKPRAERVAETVQERDAGEAQKDVVSPPKRPVEMKVDDKPVEANPQDVMTPPPPLRPKFTEETKPQPEKKVEPKKVEAKPEAKPESKPEPKKSEAKAEPNRQQLAKLVEQAELEAQEKAEEKAEKEKAQKEAQAKADAKAQEAAEAKEEAQQAAKEAAQKEAQAKADAKSKAEAKAKADAKAKALAKAKADSEAKAQREAEAAKAFNAGDIRKLLQSKEASQSTGSTGREVQRTASLGTATATGAKLNPSLRGQLIGMLQDQMQKCYSPPIGATSAGTTLPLLDIRLNTDGSLMSEPRVVRAGGGASDRAVADAAVRAVRRCAPFRVPASFAPYYNDWKTLNVEFEVPSI